MEEIIFFNLLQKDIWNNIFSRKKIRLRGKNGSEKLTR